MISLSGDVHTLPGPTSRSISKISVRCTDYKRKMTSCFRTREESNCIKIKSARSNSSLLTLSQLLDPCLWNVRSVKGKVLSLKDYPAEHDLDFLVLKCLKPPKFLFARLNGCVMLRKMAKKVLFLVKTRIFYELQTALTNKDLLPQACVVIRTSNGPRHAKRARMTYFVHF